MLSLSVRRTTSPLPQSLRPVNYVRQCFPLLALPIVVPFHLDDPPPALSVMTSYDSLRVVYRPAYI
jgi:hypothetical protein